MPHNPTNSPGITGQVSRLKHHSTASAAELRQFLGDMRGKSPKEVLGVLAHSGLVQATATAFAGSVVLMLVFTLLPAMFGGKAEEKPTVKPPVAATTPAANTTPDDKSKTTETPVAAKDGAKVGSDKDNVAKKLGINETKTADPKKNPLDNTGDDLFKDIK